MVTIFRNGLMEDEMEDMDTDEEESVAEGSPSR